MREEEERGHIGTITCERFYKPGQVVKVTVSYTQRLCPSVISPAGQKQLAAGSCRDEGSHAFN